jgi:hypothetical protein
MVEGVQAASHAQNEFPKAGLPAAAAPPAGRSGDEELGPSCSQACTEAAKATEVIRECYQDLVSSQCEHQQQERGGNAEPDPASVTCGSGEVGTSEDEDERKPAVAVQEGDHGAQQLEAAGSTSKGRKKKNKKKGKKHK